MLKDYFKAWMISQKQINEKLKDLKEKEMHQR